MVRWSVMIVILLAGCGDKRQEVAPAAPPVVVARDAAPATVDAYAGPGLPIECQRYRARVVRVAACPQLAPLDRDQVMREFLALENRWAALPPAALASLAGTCQAASDAVIARAGPCEGPPAEAPPVP